MKKLRELTRAEEEVMQILWQLEHAFVKEILAEMPEPKPAYNTVSTIVRILQDKGFVGFKAYGRSHQYHPLVTKERYSRFVLDGVVGNYFGGSLGKLVSFFAKEKKMNQAQLDELMRHVQAEQANGEPEPDDKG